MVKIMNYPYNSRCDVFNCTRMAKNSIGDPGNTMGTYHNVCDACLQDIANDMPIEVVYKMPQVHGIIQSEVARISKDIPLEVLLQREDVKEHIADRVHEQLEKVMLEIPKHPADMLTIDEIVDKAAAGEDPFNGGEELPPMLVTEETVEILKQERLAKEALAEKAAVVGAVVETYTFKELRALAKELKVTGYGQMNTEAMRAAVLAKLEEGDGP